MLTITYLLTLLPCLLASPIEKRANNQLIYAGRDNLCISIQGGKGNLGNLRNGVPVTSLPCDQASSWDINQGPSGSIFVSGNHNFALDAGSSPTNNGALKIWQTLAVPQQAWTYTGDSRITLPYVNQCLDEGPSGVQTYTCYSGNTNQIWFIKAPGTTTPPVTPPAGTTSAKISANVNGQLCVTVQGGIATVGSPVQLSPCVVSTSPTFANQNWILPPQSGTAVGLMRLASNPNLCLDAGINPSNGAGIKVWTCFDGAPQQTWSYNNVFGGWPIINV